MNVAVLEIELTGHGILQEDWYGLSLNWVLYNILIVWIIHVGLIANTSVGTIRRIRDSIACSTA